MRLALLVSLALAVAAGAATRTGVLHGTVTRGPITPVCVVAQPCSAPVAGATVVFLRAGRAVARTRTRADGTYRIRLAVGRYAVRVLRGGGRRWQPASVRVRAGRTTRLDIAVDTGIR